MGAAGKTETTGTRQVQIYLDSNVYDKLVGYNRELLFSAQSRGLVKLYCSHVVEDELAAIPADKASKRRSLVAIMHQLPEEVPSTPAVFDLSRFDRTTFGDEQSVSIYDQLKDDCGPRDAIHVATAQAVGCDFFVTEDVKLRHRTRTLRLAMRPCSFADLVSLLGILLFRKPAEYRYLTDDELAYLLPLSYRRNPDRLLRIHGDLPRIPGARLEHGVSVAEGEQLKLIFEAADSDMIQGVHLTTDTFLVLDEVEFNREVIVFFGPKQEVEYEARPRSLRDVSRVDDRHAEHIVECHTKEGELGLWNVCAYYSQGVRLIRAKDRFSGMLIEELPDGFRYRCNDVHDDDDYDDLIFRIERTRIFKPRAPPSRHPSG